MFSSKYDAGYPIALNFSIMPFTPFFRINKPKTGWNRQREECINRWLGAKFVAFLLTSQDPGSVGCAGHGVAPTRLPE